MGPNKNVCLPAPNDPGELHAHHHHVESILPSSSPKEAASHCGNPAKEANCVILELGELSKSRQGGRTDFVDAQK